MFDYVKMLFKEVRYPLVQCIPLALASCVCLSLCCFNALVVGLSKFSRVEQGFLHSIKNILRVLAVLQTALVIAGVTVNSTVSAGVAVGTLPSLQAAAASMQAASILKAAGTTLVGSLCFFATHHPFIRLAVRLDAKAPLPPSPRALPRTRSSAMPASEKSLF